MKQKLKLSNVIAIVSAILAFMPLLVHILVFYVFPDAVISMMIGQSMAGGLDYYPELIKDVIVALVVLIASIVIVRNEDAANGFFAGVISTIILVLGQMTYVVVEFLANNIIYGPMDEMELAVLNVLRTVSGRISAPFAGLMILLFVFNIGLLCDKGNIRKVFLLIAAALTASVALFDILSLYVFNEQIYNMFLGPDLGDIAEYVTLNPVTVLLASRMVLFALVAIMGVKRAKLTSEMTYIAFISNLVFGLIISTVQQSYVIVLGQMGVDYIAYYATMNVLTSMVQSIGDILIVGLVGIAAGVSFRLKLTGKKGSVSIDGIDG